MEVSNSILQIISSFIEADLRVAAPILIAAIGLLYMEKAGVVNIGAEGTMLVGALAGSIGAYIFQNPWMGALVAGIVGGLVGVLFAYLIVTVKANQIVAGIAINIFALGATTTVNRIFFGLNASSASIPSFTKIAIPFLSKIPVIGSFFNQFGLAYIVFLMVPFTYYLMKKTTIGLKIRSVGEHPEAADTAGINVFRIRYGTVIIGSIIIGVAGAYLSVGLLSFFSENMVSGRGYIALASVIFGKWNPYGIFGAAFLFGFGDALQIRLQAMGSAIPYQFLLMMPYLLTVAALAGFVGKAVAPKASGKPYFKG